MSRIRYIEYATGVAYLVQHAGDGDHAHAQAPVVEILGLHVLQGLLTLGLVGNGVEPRRRLLGCIPP